MWLAGIQVSENSVVDLIDALKGVGLDSTAELLEREHSRGASAVTLDGYHPASVMFGCKLVLPQPDDLRALRNAIADQLGSNAHQMPEWTTGGMVLWIEFSAFDYRDPLAVGDECDWPMSTARRPVDEYIIRTLAKTLGGSFDHCRFPHDEFDEQPPAAVRARVVSITAAYWKHEAVPGTYEARAVKATGVLEPRERVSGVPPLGAERPNGYLVELSPIEPVREAAAVGGKPEPRTVADLIDSGEPQLHSPRMASERREEFERRLLALVRKQMDISDRDHPDGWEITDFVITARVYYAPEPDEHLEPWAGGPYPGWIVNAWTRGSSTSYWHDTELLNDALNYTERMHRSWLNQLETEDEPRDDDAT